MPCCSFNISREKFDCTIALCSILLQGHKILYYKIKLCCSFKMRRQIFTDQWQNSAFSDKELHSSFAICFKENRMSFLIRNGFLLIRVDSVASCPFSPELFRTISHHAQLIGFCKKNPQGKKNLLQPFVLTMGIL